MSASIVAQCRSYRWQSVLQIDFRRSLKQRFLKDMGRCGSRTFQTTTSVKGDIGAPAIIEKFFREKSGNLLTNSNLDAII